MRLYLSLLAAAGMAVCSAAALAADTAPADMTTSNTSMVRPPPSVVETPRAPKPITAELNDGSKVEFDSDNSVWVLAVDGSKSTAPDGVLTLKDGVPFVVRNGKRVGDD